MCSARQDSLKQHKLLGESHKLSWLGQICQATSSTPASAQGWWRRFFFSIFFLLTFRALANCDVWLRRHAFITPPVARTHTVAHARSRECGSIMAGILVALINSPELTIRPVAHADPFKNRLLAGKQQTVFLNRSFLITRSRLYTQCFHGSLRPFVRIWMYNGFSWLFCVWNDWFEK